MGRGSGGADPREPRPGPPDERRGRRQRLRKTSASARGRTDCSHQERVGHVVSADTKGAHPAIVDISVMALGVTENPDIERTIRTEGVAFRW